MKRDCGDVVAMVMECPLAASSWPGTVLQHLKRGTDQWTRISGWTRGQGDTRTRGKAGNTGTRAANIDFAVIENAHFAVHFFPGRRWVKQKCRYYLTTTAPWALDSLGSLKEMLREMSTAPSLTQRWSAQPQRRKSALSFEGLLSWSDFFDLILILNVFIIQNKCGTVQIQN